MRSAEFAWTRTFRCARFAPPGSGKTTRSTESRLSDLAENVQVRWPGTGEFAKKPPTREVRPAAFFSTAATSLRVTSPHGSGVPCWSDASRWPDEQAPARSPTARTAARNGDFFRAESDPFVMRQHVRARHAVAGSGLLPV